MEDQHLETLLRRYRPVGPPPELRRSIVALAVPRRVWPWATAAAVLLSATLSLYAATSRLTAQVDLKFSHEPDVVAAAELGEALGGDPAARRIAEFILLVQRSRAERAMDSGPDSAPGVMR